MNLIRWLACGAVVVSMAACGGGDVELAPAVPTPALPSTSPPVSPLAGLTMVSGDGQTVRQHERLAGALVVRLGDDAGNPLAGREISGGPSIALTGADGIATIIPADSTYFHLAGTRTIDARLQDPRGLIVTFRVNVLPSPYDYDGLYRCQIGAQMVPEPVFTQMRVTSGLATMDAASGAVDSAGAVALVDNSGPVQIRYSGVIKFPDPNNANIVDGIAQNTPLGLPPGIPRFWGCSRL